MGSGAAFDAAEDGHGADVAQADLAVGVDLEAQRRSSNSVHGEQMWYVSKVGRVAPDLTT